MFRVDITTSLTRSVCDERDLANVIGMTDLYLSIVGNVETKALSCLQSATRVRTGILRKARPSQLPQHTIARSCLHEPPDYHLQPPSTPTLTLTLTSINPNHKIMPIPNNFEESWMSHADDLSFREVAGPNVELVMRLRSGCPEVCCMVLAGTFWDIVIYEVESSTVCG